MCVVELLAEARILLLVDLRDFSFRFRALRPKKSSKNDQLTGHFQSFLDFFKKAKLVR